MKAKVKDIAWNFLYRGFHNGKIDFIDVCSQRPLVATCSNEDSFVRIWNYMEFRSELSFRAKPDTPDGDQARAVKSMAFHPGGYYLALGTTSVLKLVFIMEERVFDYRDLPLKNVSLLKFSRGGQYLAAAYHRPQSSQFRICVLLAHTQEKLKEFVAHSAPCTDMAWSFNDATLYSCGEDGKLNLWSPFEGDEKDETGKIKDKEEGIAEKAFSYSSLTCDKNNKVFLTGEETTKDGVPRYVIREKPKSQYLDIVTYPFGISKKPTRICYFKTTKDHQALIVGTDHGRILVLPMTVKEGDYQKINTHVRGVTAIASDVAGRYLFTGGEDGLLNVYQVVSKTGETIEKEVDEALTGDTDFPRHLSVKKELADVVLFERKEIVVYRETLEKHKQEIEDLKAKLDNEAIKLKSELETKKKEAEEKLRQEVKKLNERYEQLMAQKQAVDAEHTNLLKANDENHLKAVEDLESLYEKKLSYENEKYLRLESELLEERENNEAKLREIKETNKIIIDKLREEFKTSYEDAKKIYDQTRETSKNLDAEYKKRLAQQEEEHEMEIRELNSKHKEEITNCMKLNSKLNQEKEAITQELNKMQTLKERYTKTEEDKNKEILVLQSKNKDLETNIEKLKKELEDTNETLRKKEKNIYDAKSKINDLQKAKHVLSFRTTEMRKSLEPKEAQIEKLKEDLYRLETEFEGELKNIAELSETLKRKEESINKLNNLLKEQTILTKKRENELNKIKMDLYKCSKSKDNKSLAQEFNKIYQLHVAEDKIKPEKQDPMSVGELKRQVDYLESSLHQINLSTEKLVKNREMQIMKRTKDNIQLIKDLNALKMSNKGRSCLSDRPAVDKQKLKI